MSVDLTKLFFWTGCANFVGFPNIRGDELQAALVNSRGDSGTMLLGSPFMVPDASPPSLVPFGGAVFDDLGVFNPAITGASGTGPGWYFPINELDPPVTHIQLNIKYTWAAATGSRTSGTLQDGGPVAALSDIVDVFPETGSAVVGRTVTATSGPIPVGPTGPDIFFQGIAAQVSGAPLALVLATFSYTVLK